MSRQISSYLYAWQLLIMRRQATQRKPEGEDELGISLEDIVQGEGLS